LAQVLVNTCKCLCPDTDVNISLCTMAQRRGACSTTLIACAWSRLATLLSMVVIEVVGGSVGHASCVADPSDGVTGSSLLQARSGPQPPFSLSKQHKSQTPMQTQATPELSDTVGKARFLLPSHLYGLGKELLQKEEVLDAFVAASVVTATPYAGVNMILRMLAGNEVTESDTYGIDSLGPKVESSKMMNMLDIGGNYGRVSIAAFKHYPTKMRIIVVEPIASTYFLLRWNLWLNGVPELTLAEFQASPGQPGVVALNHGIADVNGKITDLCYTPPNTMAARICNCSHGWSKTSREQCHHIVGLSVVSLLSKFAGAPIDLLKMDCEGCELDVIPALIKLDSDPNTRIKRFAGELHAVPNELEDFVCKFQQGQWFIHICSQQSKGKPGFRGVHLLPRCTAGPARPSCGRRSLSEMKHLPPAEW